METINSDCRNDESKISHKNLLKVCTKCKLEKDYSDFSYRRGKPDSWCKICYIENSKRYSSLNKEKIALKKKEYALKNKEHISKKYKEYVSKNKSRIKEFQREYTLKNKKNKIEYDKNYYFLNKFKKLNETKIWRNKKKQTDPNFRFKCNISKQFWQVLSNGVGKNGKKTINILNSLGYNLNDLKNHLENKFSEGMSWDNYGKWHLDHIRPVCSFKFSSIHDEDFKLCWALDNLQPLWAIDNLKKVSSDKKQSIKKYENEK